MRDGWRAMVGTSLLVILSANACEGPTGPAGPSGPSGPTGPGGPAGPPGASAGASGQGGGGQGGGGNVTGALPTSCLQPCHGFTGMVEQWKTSTHYAAFVSNLGGDEVPTWTGEGRACGNCHASDALEVRAAGAIGTQGGAQVANVTKGQIGYLAPTNGAYAESTYQGTSNVASVACLTCHAVTAETDPHRTGASYTEGAFPLRVPFGAEDEAYLEKSPTVGVATGSPGGQRGPANTCMWCHKSRKDVTNYITPSTKVTSVHWGPHDGPQADIYTGSGGYHYVGMQYGTSTHEQKATCVDCHMTPVAANGATADHSFDAKLGACTNCHQGATSFDVIGGQSAVAAGLRELRTALNVAGLLTRATEPPFGPLTDDELADAEFGLDHARPNGGPDGGPTVLTADEAGALYNYFLAARGSALGVHNPPYTKQLLFDSHVAITGQPPLTIARP